MMHSGIIEANKAARLPNCLHRGGHTLLTTMGGYALLVTPIAAPLQHHVAQKGTPYAKFSVEISVTHNMQAETAHVLTPAMAHVIIPTH
jgi:hypothetical protein